MYFAATGSMVVDALAIIERVSISSSNVRISLRCNRDATPEVAAVMDKVVPIHGATGHGLEDNIQCANLVGALTKACSQTKTALAHPGPWPPLLATARCTTSPREHLSLWWTSAQAMARACWQLLPLGTSW